MKERILRVLMVFSFLFCGGLVIGVTLGKWGDLEEIFVAIVVGAGAVILASAIQYIFTNQWHPLALFKSNTGH